MANDAANIVKDVLVAGTWTNFTRGLTTNSNPPIFILYEDKVKLGETYITLENDPGMPIMLANATLMFVDRPCKIQIFARNETDRENIFEDIKALMKASNYSHTYTRNQERSPNQQRSNLEVTIKLLN